MFRHNYKKMFFPSIPIQIGTLAASAGAAHPQFPVLASANTAMSQRRSTSFNIPLKRAFGKYPCKEEAQEPSEQERQRSRKS
jgi:hypothetical protein